MDFSFTEEQTLLRNSIRKFVDGRYTFDDRLKVVKSDKGMSDENWRMMAELGLFAVPFPTDIGGLGGTPVDTMIVMEELGRGLVVEPYLQTVVQCGGFLRHAGTEEQIQSLIPQIIEGSLKMAFAYAEPQGRFNLADLTTRAERVGDDFTLNGAKSVVIGAPWADKLIISARTAGNQRDNDGVSLFIVDKSADGLSIRDYPTVDGLRASEVTLENVVVNKGAIIGELDNALPLIEQVADESIAALCAEAIGEMKVLNDATVDYCKTREQFGQPIGKFQVLQHRMVDMFMEYEQSVSLAYMLNMKLEDHEAERRKAASAAKVQIGKAARFIGQNAIQLHGGMGMTDELSVGHYFKRLTMIDTLFGNVDHHLRRYAQAA